MSADDGGIQGDIDPDDVVILIFLGLQSLQEPIPGPIGFPTAQAVVAGGLGRVAFWQVLPGSAGAQDPENAIEDRTVIGPRMARLMGMSGRQQRGDVFPLLIGKFVASHELRYSIKGIPL